MEKKQDASHECKVIYVDFKSKTILGHIVEKFEGEPIVEPKPLDMAVGGFTEDEIPF